MDEQVKELLNDLNEAYGDFKNVNEAKMRDLEAKLDRLENSRARIDVGGSTTKLGRPAAWQAFRDFLRGGDSRVETSTWKVGIQSGMCFGASFWKNALPYAPSG